MVLDATAVRWRLLRAAGFCLVGVALGVAGHLEVSGARVPVGVLVAAAVPVLAVGWALSSRERGPVALSVATLGIQVGLHLVLMRAGHPAQIAMASGSSMPAGPFMAGTADGWMLAAHALSAVAAGWWLRRGERALFTSVRVCAACRRFVATALRALTAVRVPVVVARLRWVDLAAEQLPRSLQALACSVARRGPPAPLAL